MGSFGKQSPGALDIWQCEGCGARHLRPMQENVEEYYKSGEYREDLSQGNSIEAYFKLTDDEQPHKLEFAGMHRLRDKVVADIGAGAGPFLDTLRGVAAQTVAIEPNENYHESLRQRGHTVYPFAFSVLEHVERPREFLADIRTLLKPGGFLGLSTPNADDLMVEICPEYAAFFYRKVHLWYFTATSLKNLAEKAGFTKCEVRFDHRFDLSNAMIWMRDKRPSGLGKLKFDPSVNAVWKQSLMSQGRSDYIYAILQ
jgi:SAM-dependent methyltransferase